MFHSNRNSETIMNSPPRKSAIYPSLTYGDANAAITWLEQAFGFRKRLLIPGPHGGVTHSELSFGNDVVVMVSSPRKEEGRMGPEELAGVHCALSLYVADPDSHYLCAKKHGATIVSELKDEKFGSRGYMVRDLEGHLWYFGTYRPGGFWEQGEASSGSQEGS